MNLIAAVFSLCSFSGDPFIEAIHSKVLETIEHAENIPGLKAEEFQSIKPEVAKRWNELVETGVLESFAPDKEIRPIYVALQGIVEHVLASELRQRIQSLTGVIHTPMPATPLCTEGVISKELVDPSIADDPLRLFTVKARTTIIRDYLYQGGDLYIAYPKGGLAKRTEAQRQIYKNELEKFPSHLFDRPLKCESLDNELIGAFYLFKSREGKTYGFAIKMTQANNPQDLGRFGLWFGEVERSPIFDRIEAVMHEIQKSAEQPIVIPF